MLHYDKNEHPPPRPPTTAPSHPQSVPVYTQPRPATAVISSNTSTGNPHLQHTVNSHSHAVTKQSKHIQLPKLQEQSVYTNQNTERFPFTFRTGVFLDKT